MGIFTEMSTNTLNWLSLRLAIALLGTALPVAQGWTQSHFGSFGTEPAAPVEAPPMTAAPTTPTPDSKATQTARPAPAPDRPEATRPSVKKVPSVAGKQPAAPSAGPRRLTINLGAQRFTYSEGGKVVRSGPVSSGKRGYGTPAGSFRVLGKQRTKVSSRYAGSDGRPASMPYSIQFRSNYFIHQGRLPGYAASHGCVRLRGGDASFLFSRLRPGDPISITR